MKKINKTEASKLITNKTTRRDFLRYSAAAGSLIPLANMFLGHRAYAQGSIKRVIFFYYPNGMVKEQWHPGQGNGSISNGSSLSFSLDPLKNHHDKVIVCKNMRLDAIPAGGHVDSAQAIMAGKGGVGYNEATVDHILANQISPANQRVKVANVGVRTGRDGQIMVSKPYGVDSGQRPIPTNDPKAAADYLFANLNDDNSNNNNNALREQVLDAVLADINQLKSLSLEGVPQDKVEANEQALQQIQAGIEQTLGNCSLVKTTVTDPWANEGSTADNYGHWQHIPAVTRAQIDNAVGSLACGVSKVATVQMMRGDENVSLANYSFDGCWQHIEEAYRHMGGTPITRWYNEHSSHTASHQVFPSHAGQARWYVEQFAYLLDQLESYNILDDTVAVMLSEVGDGNDHGGYNSGVIVGGGGNALQLGRVLDCNNNISNTQLYVDLGTLLGVNVSGHNGWGGGGAII